MRVRLVVPTSRRVAPLSAMISGIRKPSPISISSPRETMTSPFLASAARTSRTAAAQLLTTMADSAPVRRSSAFAAGAGCEIIFEIAVLRGRAAEFFYRGFGERGPAEVGVEDDAGGVDDR